MAPQSTVEERASLRAKDLFTTLRVHCGCGFDAPSVREGEQHTLETGHTLVISGSIRSTCY